MIVPMIGLVATLAPTIGPTVGAISPTAVVALAVLHQYRAGHRGHGAALLLIDFDQPDSRCSSISTGGG